MEVQNVGLPHVPPPSSYVHALTQDIPRRSRRGYARGQCSSWMNRTIQSVATRKPLRRSHQSSPDCEGECHGGLQDRAPRVSKALVRIPLGHYHNLRFLAYRPGVIRGFLQVAESNFQLRYTGGNTDPKVALACQRSLLTLNSVLKELVTIKMPGTAKDLADQIDTIRQTLLEIYRRSLASFQTGLEPATISSLERANDLVIAHLSFKSLSKGMVFLWYRSRSRGFEAAEPLVSTFLSNQDALFLISLYRSRNSFHSVSHSSQSSAPCVPRWCKLFTLGRSLPMRSRLASFYSLHAISARSANIFGKHRYFRLRNLSRYPSPRIWLCITGNKSLKRVLLHPRLFKIPMKPYIRRDS